GERVVAALAVRATDRVDRGEIDDVETHLRDPRQPFRCGCEGARDPRAVLALMSAFRTWEEFVPGGEQRLRAVHDEGIFRGCAEEIPKGKLPKDLADTRVDAGGEAGVRGAGVVVESGGA